MKISYNWLKEYLDIDVPATELAEKIERSSVEVDSVTVPSDGLKKLVVGHIDSMEPHPESDHLNVCQVNVGEEELLQIVCGAPNVAVGQKVIVALPGSRIGGNVKIKRSKMRGIVSNGMICSLEEIGFSKSVVPKEWADGIYVLPNDAKNGDEIYDYLGMNDSLIDLDVTPNRGDMLSVYGTVHDVAAMYNLKENLDHPNLIEGKTAIGDELTVAADKEAAPIYKMRLVNNVKVGPSPLWLQIKLWNAGIRPINNVVDVTNYILMKYGQPMHAFDFGKVSGRKVEARFAKENETLTTLDGETHQLDPQDIVIADEKQPIGLAGVMGGLNSEIEDGTTTVALESAVFNSTIIRKTAQRHNLHTDASQHFERGVNHGGVEEALDAAAQMIHELAQGDVDQGMVIANDEKIADVVVKITLTRINHVLGTELTSTEVTHIFERLNFGVEMNDDEFTVSVPSRRWDIHIEADLIEEVARIYGYDNIPSTLPTGRMTIGTLTPKQRIIRNSRSTMEGLGLSQAISYALLNDEEAKLFSMKASLPTKLDWPMTVDHTTIRMNLISGLLKDIAYNNARKVEDVTLYEQGRVFYRTENQVRPDEEEHIAGAISGSLHSEAWNQHHTETDFYEVKGIVVEYIQSLGLNGEIDFEATTKYSDLHPGRAASISVHGHEVGFMGQVHPQIAKKFKIKPTYVFEINLQALIDMPKSDQQYDIISKYPAISRDIAILVDEEITHQQIVDLIQKRGGAFLNSVKLFDVYSGSHVPSGKRSLAYSLTFLDKEATLTDDTVNKAFEKVEVSLQKEFNVEIR
ncbi:hypothetical protein C5L31_001140 [Secundilactobacillus malefermentans]|uniref:Phenylalanine--tRNA ligase beta subunit n=1 Tax=Secundilactobacillus malefermentans TaxID=176292 RepID=A0A4R5NQN3_9LACO|nr:phenylalanine--tRNA ligase subunit beta [Secundilactobacillus malefermentans]KRM57146.1 phenylalanyl-tRNA synthetase subunit beta [Secundilactobacillus malefermentans DSM 5705 = KCTC 3548]TDG79191.1 hypothetical protein C5L31_001140 [Secundilactobacillus malefermentans]